MNKIGIIPLRKGSKGIPGKNKRKLLGRPLYQWVLNEAIFSMLDVIYIITDDHEIIKEVEDEYVWAEKVKAVLRSPVTATDIATTESAILELCEKVDYDFSLMSLIQATSPLTTRFDINNCIQKVKTGGYDSSLSVVRTKRFIWDEKGTSVNYDYQTRPQKQGFKGFLVENGAVYTCTKENFRTTGNRLGGKIGLVEMSKDTITEIDEFSDWLILESLLINRLQESKKGPAKIKAIVFDVDGVFTDGKVAVTSDKEYFKEFSLRDGMGFEILKQNGILPIVITSENSPIVLNRMKKLDLDQVYLGVKDKYSRLESILLQLGIERNQVAYVGDDINDMANMRSVAWSMAPSNAVTQIKTIADVILNNSSGDMAIRDAIDFVTRFNTKF